MPGTFASVVRATTGWIAPPTVPMIHWFSARFFSIAFQMRVCSAASAVAIHSPVRSRSALASGRSQASPCLPLVSAYWPQRGHA